MIETLKHLTFSGLWLVAVWATWVVVLSICVSTLYGLSVLITGKKR